MASITSPSHAKKLTTKSGTTYGLVHIPAKDSKPTLLLVHGYPSSSYDWRHQIELFSSQGYGIVAPDLLGYGDTDKPTAIEEYSMYRISRDVEELLDQLDVTSNVVAIAHDWGCGLLSALVRFSQERYIGYVFVAVGYSASGLLNIDAVNEMTEKALGYPIFGYWLFHNQVDAADVIAKNAEAYLSLVYPNDPTYWKTDLCPIGKVRAWTESGDVKPLPSWLNAEEYKTHTDILQAGGWTGPLNWYKQAMAGITGAEEEGLTDEQREVKKPLLYIGAQKDYVCLEDNAREGTKKWAKGGFEHISIDAGHWVYLEKRDEFDEKLSEWLKRTFGNESAKI